MLCYGDIHEINIILYSTNTFICFAVWPFLFFLLDTPRLVTIIFFYRHSARMFFLFSSAGFKCRRIRFSVCTVRRVHVIGISFNVLFSAIDRFNYGQSYRD